MGFDALEYRRRFWCEALRGGRTVDHMPQTALEFTDPRLHPYGEWLFDLVFLVAVMGAAAVAWWLARAVDAHVRRLRRPMYYEAERVRRMALAAERRRIRRSRGGRATTTTRPSSGCSGSSSRWTCSPAGCIPARSARRACSRCWTRCRGSSGRASRPRGRPRKNAPVPVQQEFEFVECAKGRRIWDCYALVTNDASIFPPCVKARILA